jgi:hypothetical protein
LGSDEVGNAIVNGATFVQRSLQYAVVGGRCTFEGDIDWVAWKRSSRPMPPRAMVCSQEPLSSSSDGRFRWPGGRIPYALDAALPNRQHVADAIAHWEAHTVIRFVLRTPENALSHPNYVRFFPRRRPMRCCGSWSSRGSATGLLTCG